METIYAVVHPDGQYYGGRLVEKVFDTKTKAEHYIRTEAKESIYEIDEWEVE